MTLTDISIGNVSLSVAEAQSAAVLSKPSSDLGNVNTNVMQLGALAGLCNGAELDASSDMPLAQRKVLGDATDSAILRFSESLSDGNVAYLRACWTRVFELAFNSKNKFMIRCFRIVRPEALVQTMTVEEAKRFKEDDQ
jgi:sodium/potassium-transporting ATPase subunit alpha